MYRIYSQRPKVKDSTSYIADNKLSILGVVLIMIGIILSLVQISWKEEQKITYDLGRGTGGMLRGQMTARTGVYYNRLDKEYLYLGIASMIIGTIIAVGGHLSKAFLSKGEGKAVLSQPQTKEYGRQNQYDGINSKTETKCPNCGYILSEPDWRCPKCYHVFEDFSL
ncbi:hypothetical protein FJZ33_02990 [Candidatus Poribacteria bacterium]|nr:hypothetical protein [Candidatus Poribacteria bacterium]